MYDGLIRAVQSFDTALTPSYYYKYFYKII